MHNYNTLEFLRDEAPFIKIDRSFQRKSCWTLSQRRNFIRSSLLKRTPYPIVVADIKTGIKASKGNFASMEKYKDLEDQGYVMVSLDGQNRLETLRSFYENEFTISGEFKGADDVSYQITNKFYKELPNRLKDAFDMLEISVSKMKNCVYQELHEIFVDINDGESLNSQEKRNAIMSWISGYIRDFSEIEKNSKLLKRIIGFKDEHISRSLDAEWFAKIFASLSHPNKYSLNSSGLDGFYRQGETRTRASVIDYSSENVQRFEEIVSMVQKSIFSRTDIGTPITQRQFWTLIHASTLIYDSSRRISNYIDFFDSVIEADNVLCEKSEESFIESKKQHTINSDNVPEPCKSNYYFHWASNQNSPSDRSKVREELNGYLNQNAKFLASLKQITENAAK